MRVLLTANASYAPPKGGSTRSNLVWLEHLAGSGHACMVVCASDGDTPDATTIDGSNIEIRSVRELSRRTQVLKEYITEFRPDWVLVSSEDVSHVLLRAAYAAAPDRLIYLAHTPQWYPFGPASWHPDRQATDILREARSVVAIAHTTADYIAQHAGVSAEVVHPPIYGTPPWPRFGSFERGYVLMINPCVVKGISIFLELARRFPAIPFAGLSGWGTTSADRQAMNALPNIRVLDSVPRIDDVLSEARLLLMPSLWYEGFGLIAMEAMLRGLPVVASDSGGLAEAKTGTGYVIRVRPIDKFQAGFDETHMPRPVEVEQDIAPWEQAVNHLLTNQSAYLEESVRSREAAIRFVSGLHAGDFETLLARLGRRKLRVLLAHNSHYFPSHGGGDKSNRLLMEALAARGHNVRVVSRVESFGEADGNKLIEDLKERGVIAVRNEQGVVRFERKNVEVHTVAFETNLRPYFSGQLKEFDPDIVVTSTDDPGQLLYELAVKSSRARLVYLIRATIATPFGPDSSASNAAKSAQLRHADAVVGVSEYVAEYARKFGGLEATHVPISLLEAGATEPNTANFGNQYVSMVNPCAVKGIDIFLALADQLPQVKFAAVPMWGTTPEDYAALLTRANVTILPPVDNIDELLSQTKVMLVPSVWAEARSRIVVEAMSRGIPVISSNAGGLPEAHLGVDYMLPVNLIRHYQRSVDMNMVPLAEVPAQDIGPWKNALERLVTDRAHWTEISERSQRAALQYSRGLTVEPFESLLTDLMTRPKKSAPATGLSAVGLSEDKRKLLALRLRQRSSAARKDDGMFVGIEEIRVGEPILFCFPWAGGATLQYRGWRDALSGVATPVALRMPYQNPFGSMEDLIEAAGPAITAHIKGRPFAFFGHSMGAGIAFELTRWLQRREQSLPCALIVSAAKAPQYRSDTTPEPDPDDEELLGQLQKLGGISAEALRSTEVMRFVLPNLRADTRLYRRYTYKESGPLQVAIHAYGGDADPNVHAEHLEAWSKQTSLTFQRREFSGGHFYLLAPDLKVVETLRADLACLRRA
ncbi:MAG: glycosyltransferase [Bryobacteraceae bacterium]|nr:glycosyltransferase [Bryobacteraceae bacterium]